MRGLVASTMIAVVFASRLSAATPSSATDSALTIEFISQLSAAGHAILDLCAKQDAPFCPGHQQDSVTWRQNLEGSAAAVTELARFGFSPASYTHQYVRIEVEWICVAMERVAGTAATQSRPSCPREDLEFIKNHEADLRRLGFAEPVVTRS